VSFLFLIFNHDAVEAVERTFVAGTVRADTSDLSPLARALNSRLARLK